MLQLVAIVEDNESVAASLALAVESIEGVRAVITYHPQTALRLFTNSQNTIAALITDLGLPTLDGFELIAQIRGLPAYSKLPALMITAETAARCPAYIPHAAPNAIISKPFSPKEVCRVLRSLLP